MGNYILIFKTTISTTIDRAKIIGKLYEGSQDIQLATVDIEDEDRILRIESVNPDIHDISKIMLHGGHHVSFLAGFEKANYGPTPMPAI
ncbi:MAG: hypothetical protein ACTJHT_10635 [Sphingobacterium sp.]|uniref:hypothetical protein n=1 Tax=Sphingobacterium sp. JB170 TaxID=1434842 RepID=UPI00117B670A|nr:hypothetical protein [Sphingobacterium sp. JB170]